MRRSAAPEVFRPFGARPSILDSDGLAGACHLDAKNRPNSGGVKQDARSLLLLSATPNLQSLPIAGVAELADARDLKSLDPDTGRAGSTPAPGSYPAKRPESEAFLEERPKSEARCQMSEGRNPERSSRARRL